MVDSSVRSQSIFSCLFRFGMITSCDGCRQSLTGLSSSEFRQTRSGDLTLCSTTSETVSIVAIYVTSLSFPCSLLLLLQTALTWKATAKIVSSKLPLFVFSLKVISYGLRDNECIVCLEQKQKNHDVKQKVSVNCSMHKVSDVDTGLTVNGCVSQIPSFLRT